VKIDDVLALATPRPWRACVWDHMERPHVHGPIPAGEPCGSKYDVPKTATDCVLVERAVNAYEADLAAMRLALEALERYTASKGEEALVVLRARIAAAEGGTP
jgi:hypothetical protein